MSDVAGSSKERDALLHGKCPECGADDIGVTLVADEYGIGCYRCSWNAPFARLLPTHEPPVLCSDAALPFTPGEAIVRLQKAVDTGEQDITISRGGVQHLVTMLMELSNYRASQPPGDGFQKVIYESAILGLKNLLILAVEHIEPAKLQASKYWTVLSPFYRPSSTKRDG